MVRLPADAFRDSEAAGQQERKNRVCFKVAKGLFPMLEYICTADSTCSLILFKGGYYGDDLPWKSKTEN